MPEHKYIMISSLWQSCFCHRSSGQKDPVDGCRTDHPYCESLCFFFQFLFLSFFLLSLPASFYKNDMDVIGLRDQNKETVHQEGVPGISDAGSPPNDNESGAQTPAHCF